MNAWTEHTGYGLTWLERPGSGGVIVLLHGIGSNAASFTPLLAHLPKTLRVIAWNAPGYGGSDPLPQDWPMAQDYAVALGRMIDGLGLKQFELLGHSLGALIAAAYTISHADRVIRLRLASPALGHGVPHGGTLSPKAQARIDDLTRLGAEAFAAARAANLVHEPELNAATVERVRHAMRLVTLPGYAQAARMLASGRLLEDAARLTVPTDVIVGAGDRVTPPEGARRLHAVLPANVRGNLTNLPATGHAIYQQAPQAFARALEPVATPTA